jgi:anti-anti-sigma regulatory factor
VNKKKPPRKVKRQRVPPPAPARPAAVELDARMTIVQAAGLHGQLVSRLTAAEPIVIDGSRVEEVDTAILQLLASLWRTARDRGVACTWHAASEPLRYTANLIGIAGALALSTDEPARERGDAAA